MNVCINKFYGHTQHLPTLHFPKENRNIFSKRKYFLKKTRFYFAVKQKQLPNDGTKLIVPNGNASFLICMNTNMYLIKFVKNNLFEAFSLT